MTCTLKNMIELLEEACINEDTFRYFCTVYKRGMIVQNIDEEFHPYSYEEAEENDNDGEEKEFKTAREAYEARWHHGHSERKKWLEEEIGHDDSDDEDGDEENEPYQEACRLMNGEEFDEAIEKFMYLTNNYPPPHDVYFYYIGWCYSEGKGDYDKAIPWLEKAYEINPDDEDYSKVLAKACHRKALNLEKNGNYDEAIEKVMRATELRPKKTEYICDIGLCYHKKGEYDTAITYFDKAINIFSYDILAHACRGDSYFCKGDFAKAVNDFKKAIEEFGPNDKNLNDKLAKAEAALKSVGKPPEGAADIDAKAQALLAELKSTGALAYTLPNGNTITFTNTGKGDRNAPIECRIGKKDIKDVLRYLESGI